MSALAEKGNGEWRVPTPSCLAPASSAPALRSIWRRRGVRVALVDRRGPGEETSYGNAGMIEGNTIFPPAFPKGLSKLLQVAFKRAPEANYHLGHLPSVSPWLLAFRRASRPAKLIETARAMRPLFARAVAEHEALMEEAGAARYLRKSGWLKIYRSERAFKALSRELALAAEFGIPHTLLDGSGVRSLEPNLGAVVRRGVHWPGVASVTNPLALTKAYALRFAALRRTGAGGQCANLATHAVRLECRDRGRPDAGAPRRGGARAVRARRAGSARRASCRLASSAVITATSARSAMPV